jgi:phosphatidylinositol glycan class B
MNVVLMVLSLTISFMIRNTSPIGWPPILLYKIVRDGSFVPFLIAGFSVFLPVVFICVCIDSNYYGMANFPVLTAYNFVLANLTEGLSKFFGTQPATFYLFAFMPLIFTVAYPSVLLGILTYAKDKFTQRGGEPPYILIVTVFYIFVFSIIAHKEARFLLPVVPFCFLMLGYFLVKQIKSFRGGKCVNRFIKFYIWVAIIVELAMGAFFLFMQFRQWEILDYLQQKETSPHSIFTMQALDTPYYTWTHRHKYYDERGLETNRTIVYRSDKDPTYARRKKGEPIQILHD